MASALFISFIFLLVSGNHCGIYSANLQGSAGQNLGNFLSIGNKYVTNSIFGFAPVEENPLQETRKKLLEGVGRSSFGDMAFSSFSFAPPFTSLLNKQSQSYGIFGEYGRGKISAFGHPGIFSSKSNFIKKLVQNILSWMTGGKKNISIGLLSFHSMDWWDFSWGKDFGLSISSKLVEKAEDFCNYDIILVSYYPEYPKQMTPEAIEKLRQYVHNGGNLFFGSHGWVWEHYGEYTKDKSLVYEKNFVSYVILKAFGIHLKRDYFCIPDYEISSYPDNL